MRIAFILPCVGKRQGMRYRMPMPVDRLIVKGRPFRASGIMLYGTFVLGYDADTPETAQACVDLAMRMKCAIAHFNLLMPFPGTTLYERLKEEQRLIYDPWWLHPAFRFGKVVFRPRGMTAAQLEQSGLDARHAFNSIGSIARRGLDWRANSRHAGIYLAANLACRRELDHRQGARAGIKDPLAPFFSHETPSCQME